MKRELMQPVRGIVPPLVTPFDDRGRLDVSALAGLVEHVLQGGVHGLFILGTTGEGPSLAAELQRELIHETCRLVDSRVPILVGITAASLADSVALAEVSADAGCDAVVAAPPFYFPLQQRELAAYFRRLADESPLPLMLYNMPGLVGTFIEPATVEQLLEVESIVGIKDSSGDFDNFRALQQLLPQRPDFALLVGAEALLAPALALGAAGGVPGGANIWPQPYAALYQASVEGDEAAAAQAATQVEQLGAIYQVGYDSIPAKVGRIKAATSLRGLCAPTMSSPLVAASSTDQTELAAILRRLGLIAAPSPSQTSTPLPT